MQSVLNVHEALGGRIEMHAIEALLSTRLGVRLGAGG